MAYKPSKKKLQTLREEPDLFSILDNGDIATNNLVEETDKVNETQEPLPYVVKTQTNTARMISRNPIEWARYLSFERRVHKDNSKEDVNFFANGEIKESSRVYEANEEGFEWRINLSLWILRWNCYHILQRVIENQNLRSNNNEQYRNKA
ncbi:hypothetical protein ACMWQJ_03745 [Helicobacter pylori]|uniref:hypothetical protein n=1 Tax=Helicobacter pylori TaxID=210 RepID=UPI0039E031AF